jgi:hypothetical protein
MAGRLRRDGLSAKAIEGAILQVNAERCSPPLDAAEVAKIARSVGRYPPATRPANPYRPATPYVAFPVGLLPSALAGFVAQTADAMGCDPAMVALPAMASAAAAIGTTRKVALKDSWHEPPIVWTCIVARSGSLKTPAFEAATRPMRDAQIESLREHREAAVAYERDLLEYERSLARWKKGKGDELPEKPEAPAATRSSSATPRLRRCRRSCRRIPAAC